MVKIVNELGEVKTGVQGEAVYQGKYGQQIRRTRQPKRAIPSQKQLEHRQLYREALAWRKALSLPNRRYLDGYCISNWIVDDYKIPLPWSRFALKLYLQHISFVMVEKPYFVYLPIYEYDVEEQLQNGELQTIYAGDWEKVAQKLTIPNRSICKLGFWLLKIGSPTGAVIFDIRRVSDDSIISSKEWGDAADLPTDLTYEEVEFDDPQTINEEVRIAVGFAYGNMTNCPEVAFSQYEVKANENMSRYLNGNWYEQPVWDTTYRYAYRVEVPGKGDIDYENSTKGLLHVKHPALLSGEHRRDGKLIEEWTNLSNLDEEYLTEQVGVDVFPGDELKFATIAGLEYSFRVP